MAKTNSKKVMLADTLGRTVAEIVSDKTKEYLNDGCVLLDFDEVSTDGLFKVLLFEDSNSEHGFRVIIVETSYIKTLKDEVFRKGFINTSKFTKVYTGTLPKEAFEQYLDVKGIFNKANKTEIYSTVCLDGKVLISFDEARKFSCRNLSYIFKISSETSYVRIQFLSNIYFLIVSERLR